MADEENPNEVKEEVADIVPFDPSKKKKKKKVVIQDPIDDDVDKLAEKTETLAVSDGLENSFSGLKKKKKKPVQTDVLTDEKENAADDFDDHIGEDEEGEGIVLQPQYPWEGSDRDYEYEELLGRVFNILRENNPELAGDRRRTVMRPPQVLREGTKKTVFVNFMDLCKTLSENDHRAKFRACTLVWAGPQLRLKLSHGAKKQTQTEPWAHEGQFRPNLCYFGAQTQAKPWAPRPTQAQSYYFWTQAKPWAQEGRHRPNRPQTGSLFYTPTLWPFLV
ncbi:hypothetical protein U1Q18_020650 [Sarracenia purpurea var. burkii]